MPTTTTTPATPHPAPWTQQARCRDTPRFLTYPLDVRAPYCAGCPVLAACQADGRHQLVAHPKPAPRPARPAPGVPPWPAEPLDPAALYDTPDQIARRVHLLATAYQYDPKQRAAREA